ncbi:MAG TPA: hypothetical protein VH855_22465 [Acetobacteraceae bacterium]
MARRLAIGRSIPTMRQSSNRGVFDVGAEWYYGFIVKNIAALVRRFLIDLVAGETEAERLKRQERVLRERVTRFRARGRLSREAVHRRGG